MSSFVSFSEFIRHGGQEKHHPESALLPVERSLELKQWLAAANMDAFEQRLRQLAAKTGPALRRHFSGRGTTGCDGHFGHGYNCRCSAAPAILDGAILLTEVTLSEGVSGRIAAAQDEGLADAATEAAAGGVETLVSTFRFSWLGYRRLFGVITSVEEAERLAMREGLIRTIATIINLLKRVMPTCVCSTSNLFRKFPC